VCWFRFLFGVAWLDPVSHFLVALVCACQCGWMSLLCVVNSGGGLIGVGRLRISEGGGGGCFCRRGLCVESRVLSGMVRSGLCFGGLSGIPRDIGWVGAGEPGPWPYGGVGRGGLGCGRADW